MATKVKKAANESKAETAKSTGKAAKAPAAKASGKAAKASADAGEDSELAAGAVVVDQDALEEQEEASEEAAASSAGGGGNAAALAAAAGTTEMSASFKNFRHHPDMENFYRFIYENDLRHEALAIIDEIMLEKNNRRMAKTGKAQAH